VALRAADVDHAANLGDGAFDADATPEDIDVAASEPGSFTEPQTCPPEHESEHSIPLRRHRFSEARQLAGVEEPLLSEGQPGLRDTGRRVDGKPLSETATPTT
jgi:hypothetical protein